MCWQFSPFLTLLFVASAQELSVLTPSFPFLVASLPKRIINVADTHLASYYFSMIIDDAANGKFQKSL